MKKIFLTLIIIFLLIAVYQVFLLSRSVSTIATSDVQPVVQEEKDFTEVIPETSDDVLPLISEDRDQAIRDILNSVFDDV